jgi:hypothetical protein
MNGDIIFSAPSPCILADMIEVVSGRREAGPGGVGLRESAWNSLLHLRRVHGSLAEARRVAELRQLIALTTSSGRAS